MLRVQRGRAVHGRSLRQGLSNGHARINNLNRSRMSDPIEALKTLFLYVLAGLAAFAVGIVVFLIL